MKYTRWSELATSRSLSYKIKSYIHIKSVQLLLAPIKAGARKRHSIIMLKRPAKVIMSMLPLLLRLNAGVY